LNSIGYQKTEVILIHEDKSEIHKNMADQVSNCINDMMRKQGITIIDDAKITHLEGDYKVEKIHFKRKDAKSEAAGQYGGSDYFLSPDMMIVEEGVGNPKADLKNMIGEEEPGLLSSLTFNNNEIPISNMRFSMYRNDIMSPILAAGSCTHYPSFFHKIKVRTDDVKYNIECGFYAAMNMLDKQVEFRYMPMTPLKIGDKQIYFVGERE